MKKLFTLIAAALVGTCAFADATFHSPGAKLAGAPFEYINISNAIVGGQTTTAGATGKYGISPEYPWIVYNYSASTLENGNAEVSRGGIWVSYNPMWMTQEFTYMVDDASAWLGSPKFELGYTKGETYLNKLCPKSMTFNVTATTRVDILLTGGGSNTNDADIIVKKADGTVVKTVYVDPMAGKSNKAAAANTNSKWAVVDGLDAAESYQITVAPSTKNAQLQVEEMDELEQATKVYKPITEVLGADVNFAQDIELAAEKKVCYVKAGAVYVAALHIFGTDLTVNGKKAVAPISDTYYSPVGNKYEGQEFAYVNVSNALQNGVDTLTTFDASGNASNAGKYSVNDNYPWIFYQNSSSVLDGKFNSKTYKIDGGKCEVSRGGYYSSIEPISGDAVVTYITDDGGLWLGSPKAEMGYTKGESYLAELNPKSVTFNVKDAKKVEILLTGAGSNTNDADIIVKEADGTYVKTVYVEPMAGKSNKSNGSASNSKWGVVDGLDAAKSYQITVAPSIQNAKLNVSVMDELEQEEKVDTPAVKILGADANFAQDIALTADQKINNVKAGTVAVLGIRVYEGEINLNDVIAAACATEDNEVTIGLDGKRTYELKGKVQAGNANQGVTILGNGAKIVTDATGQITTKNYLVIDNVDIDATASTVAPIAMAPKADITKADTATIMSWYTAYDEEEAMAYNEAHAQEIAQGTMDPIHTGDIKQASDWVAKYTGANLKVFEAQLLSLTNSKVKTAWSLISGNDAPWALHKLYLENNIIEFTYNDKKDKKENISWYGGGNSIQDITFVNNTFFCDSVSNNAYFLRYSNGSNAQPQKVWGKDGTASWTMTSNTFVNIASNGQFANNYSNKNNVTNDFKKNIFANTRYLQKIGSSIVPNFTNVDNVICGGTNAVNSDDKSKYATEESAEVLGIYVNATGSNFVPGATSIALRDQMGDPRWLENAPEYVNAVDSLSKLYTEGWDLFDTMQQPTSTEYATLVAELSVAKSILNPETGEVDAQAAYKEIAPLAAAIEAYKKLINPATGIANVAVEKAVNDGRVYNLAGQRVNANTKGMVIKNGRKYIVK